MQVPSVVRVIIEVYSIGHLYCPPPCCLVHQQLLPPCYLLLSVQLDLLPICRHGVSALEFDNQV